MNEKIKSKHDLFMMYEGYKQAIALSKASHTHYKWDDIDSKKYVINTPVQAAMKRVFYYYDIENMFKAFDESDWNVHKGIIFQKVPNTIAGGYEENGSSFEADIARVTGYYDVAKQINQCTTDGVSYIRGVPYIGETVSTEALKKSDCLIDIATSEFISIFDTVNEDGSIINQDSENKRNEKVYQSIFMLAYNGCRDITIMPCGLPYNAKWLTDGQVWNYASCISHMMNILVGTVDIWRVYIGNMPLNMFAQAMYNELSNSGNGEIVEVK